MTLARIVGGAYTEFNPEDAMKTLPARYARQHFAEMIEAAQAAPVRITKNGQDAAVLLSVAEYEWLQSLDDAAWGAAAKAAMKRGTIGTKAAATLLRRIPKSFPNSC